MRSAGLCTVCSGDNHRYFFNDKALNIDAECDRMSKKCKIHFDHFLGLIDSAFSIFKASNIISYNTMHIKLTGRDATKEELLAKMNEIMQEHNNNTINIFQTLKTATTRWSTTPTRRPSAATI